MKECNVCCCIYRIELEELQVGFNHMHQKFGLHSYSHCDCEAICEDIDGLNTNRMGFHAIFLGLITLWEVIVFPKDLQLEWHSWDCVFKKCQDCGEENLTFYLVLKEGTSDALVH
jgi:hypothetical protein